MSTRGLTRAEVPIDTRPTALVLGGLRRGMLLVFLPVFVAGQAIAWLTYAASGLFQPWSWFKIGLGQTLASVRVPFETAGAEGASLQIAIGALTVVVLVLGFRAGREQARGMERRPAAAARAGALIGLGFAIPMFAAAIPVTLDLPQFDIEGLRPVLWLALAIPLAVGAATGAAGGLDAAHDRLEHGSTWTVRAHASARGGALAFWWGTMFAFVGFLVAAAASPGPTGAYARFVTENGGIGPATVLEHAALLPNQSVLVLSTSMGATTKLSLGDQPAVEVTLSGVRAVGPVGAFLTAYTGAANDHASFPPWFAAFLLIPAVATVSGGRSAGLGGGGLSERFVRGALAGVVYAILCAIAAWAATLVVPAVARLIGGSLRLGPSVVVTFALALVWGVVGGSLGGSLAPRLVWPRASGPR
jgi:hypothetical protein